MDTLLYFLSGNDRRCLLVRDQIGLFGKIGCGVWISLHGKVVQNQCIDITVEIVSNCWLKHDCKNEMYGMVSSEKLKIDIVFPHYMLGEIPIDSSFIISPVVVLG